MSAPDFLLLSTPPWVEIPDAETAITQHQMDINTFEGHVAANYMLPITQWAEDSGLLPTPTSVVTAAQIFDVPNQDTGGRLIRVWLVFTETP